MRNQCKLAIFLFIFLSSTLSLIAQDSSSIFPWKVESKRVGDGTYELIFSTPPVGQWELYSPLQNIHLQTTEIVFNDSSQYQDGSFVVRGDVKQLAHPLFEEGPIAAYQSPTEWVARIQFRNKDSVPVLLQGRFYYTYGNAADTSFFASTELSFAVSLEGGVESAARIKISSIDLNNPATNCGDSGTKNQSILSIFLLGVLGGIIALVTPCVFPMIPVTVTFFTKRSADRKRGIGNAVLYGFFIFMIYCLITVPFHIASKTISPEIFNNISTNVVLNFIFFVVFVVFALSFFGLFEIGLPAGLANRAGSKSGLGNVAGIFFMAGTLAIVSFSCTGPILGTLLANVAVEGAWPLTAGAAGFGLALGLPFALFAMFPNWLQSLPRSGRWMTEVKVVLGFVELALAVKFFSNADLVKQWGLLKREVFIALWVFIGLAIVTYLFISLWSQKRTQSKFSWVRIFFILLFAGLTIYLVPGLTNTKYANLTYISGFPPPLCYSVYDDPVNCKTGFKPLEDYEEALAKAKQQNKPLLIDFTGWACVNCRKMEESVWTDPLVDSLMHTEFVVVSLYVDERRKLSAIEQTVFKTSAGKEKSIVTVGDKWATFQTENFGATSQPQYAILSPDEKALTLTKFYTPDADEFAEWLRCGLSAFKRN
ncbi:MAG: thioredoxin family protein [Chitinophagaceae bacterium]|nr:thioredoxin family protein [Chitinophagaceae bacterium]